ncbi:MAG: A24 family peptidase [Blautia sp.]|nr:A24 family peptidase [Blautia sp.]
MQLASELTLYAVVIVAVVQDYRSMKISNRLILTGLVLSLVFGIILGRTSELIYILGNIFFPVILLYLLYLIGVLGAGDIKLFSVIGGFTDVRTLTRCIFAAFIAGAVIAVVKMLANHNLKSSLWRSFAYLQALAKGERVSYRGGCPEENLMHFSVAILIGLLAAKTGILP